MKYFFEGFFNAIIIAACISAAALGIIAFYAFAPWAFIILIIIGVIYTITNKDN